MPRTPRDSDFLNYLISIQGEDTQGGDTLGRIPSLNELSKQLGVSVAVLREQLEVAKALGLVDVRPRTGIRRLPYSFVPAVRQSLMFALACDVRYFMAFADLRNKIEESYWDAAVCLLTPADLNDLQSLVARARDRLQGTPVQIPHAEHRQLHLGIYRRLENPFVIGLLEAYWDAYETVGYSMYADYSYLQQVWDYHQQMVDAIVAGDYERGYRALVQHKDMLHQVPLPVSSNPTS